VDWNFRRLRLGAKYETDLWGAVIMFRGGNMLNRVGLSKYTTNITYTNPSTGITSTTPLVYDVKLKDNRGYIHEAAGYVKIPFASTKIIFGQMNLPFNREYIGSSAYLVSLERSMITAALPQFDIGVMVQASPLKEINKKWENYLQMSFAVSNGRGGGGDFGTGRRQDLTASNRYVTNSISPMYTGRIFWNVFGGYEKENTPGPWVEGLQIFQNKLKISLGTGFTSTKNLIVDSSPPIELTPGTTKAFNYLRSQSSYDDNGGTSTVTSGGLSVEIPNYAVQNAVTTPSRPKLGLFARTYDATITWKGIYFNGAFTRMIGGASNQLNGWHATLGYNIQIFDKYWIMPLVKYDYLNGDFNRNGSRRDLSDTMKIYWAGLNFFGDKHDFKVQLYYQVLGNHLDINPNTGNPMPIDDRRITLQIQTNFSAGTVAPEDISYRSN
ncbi:MAG: hypothetical protein KDK36_19535, partial [Leptospiraceae bacterium]|nr:hypothetical protein [Leptospiraceae bacterium]